MHVLLLVQFFMRPLAMLQKKLPVPVQEALLERLELVVRGSDARRKKQYGDK
jgi:hypothetical protein